MHVLVTGATKGGVGKTTLSSGLAVEAVRRGKKVAIIDLDPQQSLARWVERRAERDNNGPHLIDPRRDLERTIARLQGEGWDWLIIDTPPALIGTIEPAVAAADLVLIPVRPSPIDVEAVDVIVDLAAEHGKDFVFVLNATTSRSKVAEGARLYLEGVRKSVATAYKDVVGGDVLDIEIVNRLIYSNAMLDGGSAAEAEPKGAAAAELGALWSAIEKRVARAADKKKRVRR